MVEELWFKDNLHLSTHTGLTAAGTGGGVNVAREELKFLLHANVCSFLTISTHSQTKLLGHPEVQQSAE